MGIMSKNSRLPERPKPPTLNEIEDDLLKANDTDIALSVGEKNLQNIELASSCCPPDSGIASSPDSGISSSVNQMEVSQSQIKESYNKVLRLLDLYSKLKNAPNELDNRVSKLQVAGAEMSESISHLKSLSPNVGVEAAQGEGTKPKGKHVKSSTSKEKSKVKRKK